MPTTEDLAHWRAENEAGEPAMRKRMERERARAGSAQGLYLCGSIVAGFAIYALVRGPPARTGHGPDHRPVGDRGRVAVRRGALGLLIIAFGAPVYGVLLSLIYRWLYRRFLAPG